MSDHTQSGVRKNPAPHSRQHGLRLATDKQRQDVTIGNNPHTEESLELDLATEELKVPLHAAPQAPTAETDNAASHLLTVSEVAQLLQVPVSWVYARTRQRANNRLPGYRLGKYWRFDRDEVLAWVQRQCKDARAA